MQHRVTDYNVRMVRETTADGTDYELVPAVKLLYLDTVIAEYTGWSVADFFRQLRDSLGKPAWSPPVLIDVRVVRCTCRRNIYCCTLE